MKKGLILVCMLLAALMALPAMAQSTGVSVDGKTYVITGGDGTYELDGKTFVIEGNAVIVRREGQEDLRLTLEAAEESDVVSADAGNRVTVYAQSEMLEDAAVYTFAEDVGDVVVTVTKPGEAEAVSAITFASETAGKAVEFSDYAKYGLSYDANHDLLYYQGTPVRILEDEWDLDIGSGAKIVTAEGESELTAGASTSLCYFNDAGEVDVRALRDDAGELTGLEALSDAEFATRDLTAWLEPNVTRMEMTATGGEALTQEELKAFFAPYESFGLRYDAERDLLFYGDKQVRKLVDYRKTNGEEPGSGNFSGVLTQLIYEGGEVDVTTIRDYDRPDAQGEGELVGLEVTDAE